MDITFKTHYANTYRIINSTYQKNSVGIKDNLYLFDEIFGLVLVILILE